MLIRRSHPNWWREHETEIPWIFRSVGAEWPLTPSAWRNSQLEELKQQIMNGLPRVLDT